MIQGLIECAKELGLFLGLFVLLELLAMFSIILLCIIKEMIRRK